MNEAAITIRELQPYENAQDFADYINALVAEKAMISVNKPVDQKIEQDWLNGIVRRMHDGLAFAWVAESEGKPIAVCTLERGMGRLQDNVEVGITVSKSFRNQGLGSDLIQHAVQKAKEWNAVNIWLRVAANNTVAQKLYHILGFRPIARMPKWYATDNGRVDEIMMVLKE